jgi:hypothetical protein
MEWRYEVVSRQARQLLPPLLLTAALLALCMVLRPAGLAANDGLSYYAIFWATFIPYTAALLIYEHFLWKTAEALGHSRKYRLLALALKIMALLVIGLLLTPINLVEDFHSLIGLVLFVIQLAVSFKLLAWGFDWIDAGLVTIEVLGLLAALSYASYDQGLLLQSQIVFQVAFITLLVRSFSLLHIQLKQSRKRKQGLDLLDQDISKRGARKRDMK